MSKIMVTTDGSELGDHALAHAQALAGALGAELTVLSIQLDPFTTVAGEYAYLPPSTPEDLEAQRTELRQSLTASVPGAHVIVEPAAGRHVSRAILDVARQQAVNMIIMTTHGRSGLGRALLGSVAEAVTHHSPVPVLLIKGDMTPITWKATAPTPAEATTAR